MKVIFVGSSSMGPRYIMGLLKKHCHSASGIYQGIDEYLCGRASGFEPPISLDKLIGMAPDIIGFSVDSSSYMRSVDMAEKIKAAVPGAFIIFGGVHATILPEAVIAQRPVDAVCLGEGEYPMLELCEAMKAKTDITNIRNLWIKDKNGTVHRNPMRPYEQDLDALEMDREGLYYYGIFSGRGCIGNCSFCNTPAIKRAGASGRYLRKRSVDKVLDEITFTLKINRRYLLDKYMANPLNSGLLYELFAACYKPSIRFKDDSFLAKKDWFIEFARKFAGRFPGVSYMCNARADEVDEDVGEWLRRSRCERVGIGFECGNEKYRNNILKKNITNDKIIRCVDILRRNKVQVLGQWIIGLPGETLHNAIESLQLSIKIGDIPQVHIAQPFPRTEMHNQAVQMGLIDERYIPESGVYADFIFHKGESEKAMRLIYNLFSFKDLRVPKDFEIFSHLGRLRVFADKTLGDVLSDGLD